MIREKHSGDLWRAVDGRVEDSPGLFGGQWAESEPEVVSQQLIC